ncbi:hypothetical protein [Psychroserpens ponticola]|uniref:Chromosome partitioning protein ParA n=1 Tax=Psychroserpens ponticola TaxID=2932268 RepID=A0ABY7RWG5_9FLAO|nr:hypothetical protein [Psychroserpens ponticola]WCO01437.1 hypothetical protein MUN68_015400 [Psychroserpens ponticola]
MIVNPQLFNYRLIIGSLIVAVTILGVFSYTNYQSISAHQQFLEQEKKLVENELSQMITRYDDVSISNDLIASQLEVAKKDTELVLDSLSMLRSDLSVISRFKQQLHGIKLKNKTLFSAIDSLDLANQNLKEENIVAHNELVKQRRANNSLLEANNHLNRSLEKGALLTANSFKAKSYTKILGKKQASNKAKKVDNIEVCFTLAENSLTKQGEKDIYIQIVNPQNNVVADKGAINFGNTSLIYSSKTTIDYNNEVLDICLDIEADVDEKPLTAGTYFITIFNKDRKLGNTQVKLN